MELGFGPFEHEHVAIGRRPAHVKLPLQRADRTAGLFINFQRPNEPADVVWVQARRRGRIDLG